MTSSSGERTEGSAGVKAVLVTATAAIALSAWAVLAGRPVAAGAATGVAGALSVAAAYGVRLHGSHGRHGSHGWHGSAFDRVADSVVDRLLDGAVFGSIAWATREGDPATSAGALAAMGAGFLGSYVRARGTALGYAIQESPAVRGLRYGLLALGLLAGWLAWTVWAVTAISVLAAAVRASQVAREERT
jgi:hypothetical protein